MEIKIFIGVQEVAAQSMRWWMRYLGWKRASPQRPKQLWLE